MIGTTVNQSKTLMDVGLETSTADMSYIKNPRDGKYLLVATPPLSKSDIPCWSIGALWQICKDMNICIQFFTDEDEVETVIGTMVDVIAEDVKKLKTN